MVHDELLAKYQLYNFENLQKNDILLGNSTSKLSLRQSIKSFFSKFFVGFLIIDCITDWYRIWVYFFQFNSFTLKKRIEWAEFFFQIAWSCRKNRRVGFLVFEIKIFKNVLFPIFLRFSYPKWAFGLQIPKKNIFFVITEYILQV